MNSIQLSGTNNIPLTSDLLAFMQASYTMLEKLSAVGGDNYILSGCTVTGTSVSDGWVVLRGLLMPFRQGAVQANVRIVQTVNTYTVGGGSETETSYHAEFGTSTNPPDNIAWDTLNANRIYNLLTVRAAIDWLENQNGARMDDIQTLRTDAAGEDARLQEQLNVLNRAKVMWAGKLTTLLTNTTAEVFFSRPDLVVSVGQEPLGAPKYLFVNHNIGHGRYTTIVTGTDNYLNIGVIQQDSLVRIYARRRTDDIPQFADCYVTLIVYS